MNGCNHLSILFGIEANPGTKARKPITEETFQHGNTVGKCSIDHIKRSRFLRSADRVPVGCILKSVMAREKTSWGWFELDLYS
jgi:hypothetical protein